MLELIFASVATYDLVMGIHTSNPNLSMKIVNTYISIEACERDRNTIIQFYDERMRNLRNIDFKNFYNSRVYIACHKTGTANFQRVRKEDLRYFENDFLGLIFHEYNRCRVYNRCQ